MQELFTELFHNPILIGLFTFFGEYAAEKILDVNVSAIMDVNKNIFMDDVNRRKELVSQLYDSLNGALKDTCLAFDWEYDDTAMKETLQVDTNVWSSVNTPAKITEILSNAVGHEFSKDVFVFWLESFSQQIAFHQGLYNYIHAKQTSKIQVTEPDYPVYLTDRPMDQIKNFIGRDTQVNAIWDKVCNLESILLSGIGGMGKTEIMKSIAKLAENTESALSGIKYIAWVTYNGNDLRYSLTQSLFLTCGIPEIEEAWQCAMEEIGRFRDSLLLLIDNVESSADPNLLRIGDLPCRVVVTGRVDELSSLVVETVDTLSADYCVDLFQSIYTLEQDRYIIKNIVELADKHTITVELLARVAEAEEKSLKVFLQTLIEHGFNLSDEEVDSTHERLKQEARIQEHLKILFQITSKDKVEEDLLIKLSVIPSIPFVFEDAKRWFCQKNRAVLTHLIHSGWLQKRMQVINSTKRIVYIIHSVIASSIRMQFENQLYEKCRYLLLELSKEMKISEDEHGSEKIHLIQFSWSINDILKERLCTEKDAGFLLRIGKIYLDIANYPKALEVLKRAVEIYQRGSKGYLWCLSTAHNLLGMVYNEMYEYDRALEHYAVSKDIMDHLEYYSSVVYAGLQNNIGLVYLAQMNPAARNMFQEAYETTKQELGEDNIKTNTFLLNLGESYKLEGDNKKALEICQKALEKEIILFGENHLRTATTYNTVGDILSDMGDFAKALSYLNKALLIRIKRLGSEHPSTTDLYNSIGLILVKLGKFEDAIKCFNIVKSNNIKIFGEHHPNIATVDNNLALIYFDQGEYEKANDLYDCAIKVYMDFFGKDHPKTANVLVNKGYALQYMGRVIEAIDYYYKALNVFKRAPARYKIDIANVYGDIANAYCILDERKEAAFYFEQAIEMIIKECGENFYLLTYIYHNYALLIEEEGNKEKALEYFRLSRKILIQSFGNQHPSTCIIDEKINHLEAEMGST